VRQARYSVRLSAATPVVLSSAPVPAHCSAQPLLIQPIHVRAARRCAATAHRMAGSMSQNATSDIIAEDT